MACDLGSSVLGADIVPCQWAVSLFKCLLEEVNERWVGGKDLSVVYVHDDGAFLGGVCGIMTMVNRHVEGSGEWVVRIDWREETDGCHGFGEAELEEVIGLFQAVQSSNYFYPLACEGVWQVLGESHDDLLAACGGAGEALVEEGAGDVEVFVNEAIDRVGELCIGVVGREGAFPGGVVGSTCGNVSVGMSWLLVAATGEARCDAAVAFELDEHEAGDADGVVLDGVVGSDGPDGVVLDCRLVHFTFDGRFEAMSEDRVRRRVVDNDACFVEAYFTKASEGGVELIVEVGKIWIDAAGSVVDACWCYTAEVGSCGGHGGGLEVGFSLHCIHGSGGCRGEGDRAEDGTKQVEQST